MEDREATIDFILRQFVFHFLKIMAREISALNALIKQIIICV